MKPARWGHIGRAQAGVRRAAACGAGHRFAGQMSDSIERMAGRERSTGRAAVAAIFRRTAAGCAAIAAITDLTATWSAARASIARCVGTTGVATTAFAAAVETKQMGKRGNALSTMMGRDATERRQKRRRREDGQRTEKRA